MSEWEPEAKVVRRKSVKRLHGTGVLLALGLLLAACGDEPAAAPEPQATSEPSQTATAPLRACQPKDAAIRQGRDLTTLDLDGDGAAEGLRLVTAAPCSGVVFAETADGLVSATVPVGQFRRGVEVLTVPGLDAQLFSTRETHPRGGFQVRVYGLEGTAITELRHEGASIVPFVATDVAGLGTSADCAPKASIVVTSAAPDGQGQTVTVWQQSFTVADGTVSAGERKALARELTGAQLALSYPEVARNRMFANC